MPRQFLMTWVLVCFAGGMAVAQPSGGKPLWRNLAQANTTDDSLRAQNELLKYYVVHAVDTAEMVSVQARRMARKRGKKDKLMGEVYYRCAVVLHRRSQFEQIKPMLDTATIGFRASGFRLGEGLAINILATIEGIQGHYPQAVDYLLQVLQISDQLPQEGDNLRLRGMCLNNLAGVYLNLQNYPESIRYLKRSIALNAAEGDSTEIPKMVVSIGRNFRMMNQLDSAEVYLEKALHMRALRRDNQDMAFGLSALGELQLEKGCIPEAVEAFEQALAIPFSNQSRRANVQASLAKAYLLSRKYEKGHTLALSALALAEKHHFQDAKLDACEVLYEYHKHKNEPAAALRYHERTRAINDSISGDDVKTSVIRQETAYLLEKKQRELAFAEARRQEQERQAALQFRYLLGMGAALLLMAVLAFFLARNIRQKHLVNRQLREQSEFLQRQKTEIETQAERTGQLNKIKDRLLSVMAHDMRSPFSTLQGLLPLITAKAFSEEKTKAIVDQLFKLSQSTVTMMEDVLLWANAELRGGVSHLDILYPADLALEVFAFLEEPAGAKNIALHQEITEKVSCFGNVGDVRLILRNLVSNAVKFTPAGGSIRLFSAEEGDFVKISVADTGTGMTDEQIGQLLRSDFVRSTPGTAGEKGTGLGLMLCMEFVQRNGGEMSIESELGKGSTFSFTLPVNV